MKNLNTSLASMRTMAALVFMLVCGVSAMADNKVYIEDFSIIPGETKEVSVMMTNDTPISSLQFDLVLPQGLSYSGDIVKNLTRITRTSHSIVAADRSAAEGFVRFMIAEQATDPTIGAIKGSEGALFTFAVTASAGYLGGDITVCNVFGTNNTNPEEPVEVEIDNSVAKATIFAGTLATDVEALELVNDETAPVQVLLANQVTAVGLQADIVLPEGVSLAENEEGELFGYTDRLSDNVVITGQPLNEKNGYRVIVTSLTNDVFEGNEGALFSFLVKGSTEVPEDAAITIENVMISTKEGHAFSVECTNSVSVSHTLVLAVAACSLEDGASYEKMAEGDVMTLSTNMDDAISNVSFAIYEEVADAENPGNVTMDYLCSMCGMTKTEDGTFSYEFPVDYVLYEGHEYKVEFTCTSETKDESGYLSVEEIGTLVLTVKGASEAFTFSSTKNTGITPETGSEIEAKETTVTLTFDGAVTVDESKTFINEGQGATAPFASVTSNEAKTEWSFVVPESAFAGKNQLVLSFGFFDEAGKVVEGTEGNEATSYFIVEYEIATAKATFETTPADGSIVESLTEVLFSSDKGIACAYLSTEKITVVNLATNEVVATVTDEEFIWDEADEYKAVAIKGILDNAVTEAGSYSIRVPENYFVIGDGMQTSLSAATTLTFTIEEGTGVSVIASDDTAVKPVNVYTVNGVLVLKNVKMKDALRQLQKGIYIINGTKVVVR